ncbi:Longitudinals lacking protein, isoforms A/B/D/L [Cyphomyrmex costatus]|uniref:Longitudinals lacking protein, isoforms A/B/D/L n=1 Tax=Cyphomyrmex costatus TaxID=456900 RepID=A0A195CRV0_9HYME|nr:Longitudinals lacking protein, isoforms A/B/D/L [Cyphomyrmex costatus]
MNYVLTVIFCFSYISADCYWKHNLDPSPFPKFVCESCGKIYRTLGSLKYHRVMECRKEPKFACTLCNYRSRRKSNLVRHMRVHCRLIK